MRSTVLIFGLGGNMGKNETELNERIAEKDEGRVGSSRHANCPAFIGLDI